MTDENFIARTLGLAVQGRGYVSPNPMVGAVIVKDGEVIGQGYHARYGLAHAEVAAFESATKSPVGATLYVNLEPCSHFGRQPPCAQRIVDSGVSRVVLGTLDPNPLVEGKGMRFLRDHGVDVVCGVEESKCRALNEAFFKHIQTGRPLLTLKIAQTLDGRITAADGGSKWISSKRSRWFAHRLRAQNDAIIAGIGTVLIDDPQLNVRLVDGVDPLRVVLDSKLRIPLTARMLNDELAHKTVVATTPAASEEDAQRIEDKGAEVLTLPARPDGKVDLDGVSKKLGERGIVSAMIEGGAGVFSGFLRAGLVDRVAIFVSPQLVGAGLSAVADFGVTTLTESLKLTDVRNKKIGRDILITGRVK